MLNRLFNSLISLVIAIFFLMLGVVSIMLPWSPSARADLIDLILQDSMVLAFFGLGFILIGLSIVIHIALNARHHYYHIKTGPYSIQVDESIIQDYLDSYWRQLFPYAEVPNRFMIKRNKIHITADLPYVPPSEQKILLKQSSDELAQLLESFLGYRQPLTLSASFQPEPRK